MALDHYVPQVHLRRFASAVHGGRLNAVRKRDGVTFSPRTQDVCRIDEGNTNPYLQEPRAVEAFLRRSSLDTTVPSTRFEPAPATKWSSTWWLDS